MSERSFRIVLSVVVLIWGIFVLLPALVDFVPRAWAVAQLFLPGSQPRVVVEVREARFGQPLAGVRVQVFFDQSALVAETDEKGIAAFQAVPAGPARTIKAQKLDYDVNMLANITIPGRQRVQYKLRLVPNEAQRMVLAHEAGGPLVGFSMMDLASRLPLAPPGEPALWDGRAVLDVKMGPYPFLLFLRLADRVVVLSSSSGSLVRELPFTPPVAAIAISPSADTLYVLAGRSGQTGIRSLMLIETRTWQTRSTLELRADTDRATIAVSQQAQQLYLATHSGPGISVFDTRTLRGITSYPTTAVVKDMAVSSNGHTLYALVGGSQPILAFDTTTHRLQGPILDNDTAAPLAEATRLIYAEYVVRRWLCALLPGTDSVAIIDLNSKSVQILKVGRQPADLVADRDERLYVANKADHFVSVISLTNQRLIDTVPVRSRPIRLILPP